MSSELATSTRPLKEPLNCLFILIAIFFTVDIFFIAFTWALPPDFWASDYTEFTSKIKSTKGDSPVRTSGSHLGPQGYSRGATRFHVWETTCCFSDIQGQESRAQGRVCQPVSRVPSTDADSSPPPGETERPGFAGRLHGVIMRIWLTKNLGIFPLDTHLPKPTSK